MAIRQRFAQAWRAFTNKDPTRYEMQYMGTSYSLKPDRPKFSRGIDRTIVTSFYNRVAVDCATTRLQHVRLDDEDRFIEEIDSPLNFCFNQMANIDQTGREFLRDCVISLLDEGCIAIVPITTDRSIVYNSSFDIYELRVAKVLQWFPKSVRVRAYNEETGNFEEVTLPKDSVALVENPFYSVMNEPNSILQRLIHKLSLIDTIDEQNASGKLDLIIQLPYVIKTESRQKQAEERRKQIETQLTGSKYGIAYTDGSEHITQLNRPVENNIMAQVEYYTKMFYNEMGISEEIMNGTAKEEEKNEYFNHIIEPILTAITEAMTVKFLSLTARTQHQAIRFYRQPFKLVSMSSMAELADKFTRNAILSSNEIRQIIGLKPSSQPGAEDLSNKNNLPAGAAVEGMVAEEAENPLNDVNDFKTDLSELQNIDKSIQDLEQLAQSDEDEMILVHSYASKYYDPVKAHEYYEEHKTLKGYENRYGGSRGSYNTSGNPSTKGLNEKGREVARIVRAGIRDKQKSLNEQVRASAKEAKEQTKEERKATIADLKSKLSTRIAEIKSQMDGMNEAQKKHMKIKIRHEISTLKKEADSLREYLSEHYTQVISDISAATKNEVDKNKVNADAEYANELQRMLNDPALKQVKKGSSKKKSSKELSPWAAFRERKAAQKKK